MKFIVFLLGLLINFNLQASTILLIDVSDSMWAQTKSGSTRTEEANQVIRDIIIPKLSGKENVAIWSFGGKCSQLRFEGRMTSSSSQLQTDLNRVGKPDGSTPLSWSIKKAVQKLNYTKGAKHLIVVTDGLDTCNEDACAMATNNQNVKIKIHIVGMGVTPEAAKGLECIATATDGTFNNIDIKSRDSRQKLSNIMDSIAKTIVTTPGRLILKLLDSTGQPKSMKYEAISLKTGIHYKGQGNIPLKLLPGKYRLSGSKEFDGKVISIATGRLLKKTYKVKLGYLKLPENDCWDKNLSVTISDSANKMVTSLVSGKGVNLPPGKYYANFGGMYPYIPAWDVRVYANRSQTLNMQQEFGQVIAKAKDADGQEMTIELDFFSDNYNTDGKPVLTASTNKKVPLLIGYYNIVPTQNGLGLSGGDNVYVTSCRISEVLLKQSSAVHICGSSGSATLYDDNSDAQYSVETNQTEHVPPGEYNIRLPNGAMLDNEVVGSDGVTRINCSGGTLSKQSSGVYICGKSGLATLYDDNSDAQYSVRTNKAENVPSGDYNIRLPNGVMLDNERVRYDGITRINCY